MPTVSKLVLAALLLAVAFPSSQKLDDDPTLEDATLNDVQFVDAMHGWAVGERGVIWHTDDGGGSWQIQPSGTVCSLKAVCSINQKTGWIDPVAGWPPRPLEIAAVSRRAE